MILRLLCIWLVFYSLLLSLMHGTMNLKFIIKPLPKKKKKLYMEVLEYNETEVYTQNNFPVSVTVLRQTTRGNGHVKTVTLCTFPSLF
jgi:hypothetical protein